MSPFHVRMSEMMNREQCIIDPPCMEKWILSTMIRSLVLHHSSLTQLRPYAGPRQWPRHMHTHCVSRLLAKGVGWIPVRFCALFGNILAVEILPLPSGVATQ